MGYSAAGSLDIIKDSGHINHSNRFSPNYSQNVAKGYADSHLKRQALNESSPWKNWRKNLNGGVHHPPPLLLVRPRVERSRVFLFSFFFSFDKWIPYKE